MKPIATLRKALRSVDIRTKEPFDAAFERSDICAVGAASVVGEAMVAIVLRRRARKVRRRFRAGARPKRGILSGAAR